MKKIVIAMAALLFLAGNACAVTPTIDGLVTSVGEWAGSQISGIDGDEGTIDDSWDISAIYMKVIGGDGWYFRMDTWGTPTFTGGPGSVFNQAYFQFYMDIDDDNAPDYLVDLNDMFHTAQQIVSVYNSTPTEIGNAGTDNAISSIIEMYVPDSLLSTDTFFDNVANNPFGIYARLDGNGDQPDDKLPNSGFIKTPEPTTLMLLGFGFVGFAGTIRRKFRT